MSNGPLHNAATIRVIENLDANGDTVLFLTWQPTDGHNLYGTVITQDQREGYDGRFVMSEVTVERFRDSVTGNIYYSGEEFYLTLDDAIRNL